MNPCESIQVFYDGVNLDQYGTLPYIKGFTTNPTLLHKANLQTKQYKDFALFCLTKTRGLPVSFEVFADDYEGMLKQAQDISSWDSSIYVKIPIVNTKGESMVPVITELNRQHIKVNVTAIFTKEQVRSVVEAIQNVECPMIISLFCGRIADTGRDPMQLCAYAKELCKDTSIQILWASVREVYNLLQAIESGCDIITIPDGIMKKLPLLGKDLSVYSQETVQMFYRDAIQSEIKF